MRILVTGSRDWDDKETLQRAILNYVREIADCPFCAEVTIIQGGARGADDLACQLADLWGWPTQTWLAHWDSRGKRAGILRNMDMVDSGADVCLAFIKNNSPGATHCASYAESKGIPVRRFLVW